MRLYSGEDGHKQDIYLRNQAQHSSAKLMPVLLNCDSVGYIPVKGPQLAALSHVPSWGYQARSQARRARIVHQEHA